MNLHDLEGHQALNLARLPIPPLRRWLSYFTKETPQIKSLPAGAFPPGQLASTLAAVWRHRCGLEKGNEGTGAAARPAGESFSLQKVSWDGKET